MLITADPERLLQIVSNLLNNALKFTPQGGFIAIRLMSSADSVNIEIEDSGIGVAPEQLEHIFERFYQTKERGGNGAGLGLGLSLVKRLVELQGGHVCAVSQGHGKGTRFVVELPTNGVRTSEASVLPSTSVNSPTPAVVVGSQVLRDVRVLIVEDKEDALIALRAQCERQGASTLSAANGQEALNILMQHPVDLILSDLVMPVVGGYQWMQSWRALEAQRKSAAIPAIAMSALAAPKDKLRAQAAGFNLHIAKPVYREELLAAVRSLNLVPNTQRTMDEFKSKPA
jgi:CheY-like chemotaxis protein